MDTEIKTLILEVVDSAYSGRCPVPNESRTWRSVRCRVWNFPFPIILWNGRPWYLGPSRGGALLRRLQRLLFWSTRSLHLLCGMYLSTETVICKWARFCIIVTLRIWFRLFSHVCTAWIAFGQNGGLPSVLHLMNSSAMLPVEWDSLHSEYRLRTFSVLTWQHEIMQHLPSDITWWMQIRKLVIVWVTDLGWVPGRVVWNQDFSLVGYNAVYSPLEASRRFGGTCRRRQGRRLSRNKTAWST
jgi:hypothetical protein